jgi:hypothetical protein
VNGLQFTTPATVASPISAYALTRFGASAANYAIGYLDGTLSTTSGALPSTVQAVNNRITQTTAP